MRIAVGMTLAIALGSWASPAAAANEGSLRVAVLAPATSSFAAKVKRNLVSLGHDVSPIQVTSCSRDIVVRSIAEVESDAAVCFDGDAASVWHKDGEKVALSLIFAVPEGDERSEEVNAARAAMAVSPKKDGASLSGGGAPAPSGGAGGGGGGITIVARGDGTTSVMTTGQAPGRDTPPPATKPLTVREKIAPSMILSAGPSLQASKDGAEPSISADVLIGVSRGVAVEPWFMFAPGSRDVSRPEGTAAFRPVLMGFGFNVPLLGPANVVVPRIGCGYGISWIHVFPESATTGNVQRGSEDLAAPFMYVNAAASFMVTKRFRIVGEGMGAVASHEMVVRIANNSVARWGPLHGTLAIRAEWVIP